MTYNEFVQTIQTILVNAINNTDPNFTLLLPRMIEEVELRMCRDFDFLNTRTTSTAVATVSGIRSVTAPATFIVLEAMNVISPAGTANPANGTRVPLERVSLDFMNFTWPTAATTGTPAKYALLDAYSVQLAPTPNGAYTCEFIGTARPTPLSPTNTTNFLSLYLPDLYVAAAAVWGAGAINQNYGAQSDNKMEAMSWENQYQLLKSSAMVEEARKMAITHAVAG